MKKICSLKRLIIITACFGVFGIGQSKTSLAQSYIEYNPFISREARPGWMQRYENFGNYDMKKNPLTLPERLQPKVEGVTGYSGGKTSYNPAWNGPADPVSFDQFGNFLLPGGNIYNLTWDLSDVGADNVFAGTAASIFNNLMIASEEYSNWTTKFMVGRNLRAYFTPSTLKRTYFDGIRWDASSRKNSFTLLASVGSRPTDPYAVSPSHWQNLFGAYWESVLGDVMKIGGTFVAQQRGTQSYSNMDIDRGIVGLKETEIPRFVYVVITDDSPDDPTNGAMVNEVQAIVNGQEMPLPQRVFKIPDALNIYKYSQDKWTNQYLFTRETVYLPKKVEQLRHSNASWFLSLMGNNEFNQFFNRSNEADVLGYINVPDPNNLNDAEGRFFKADQTKGYLEAFGTDLIIYEFLIPRDAKELSFNVLCANDYCIDIVAAMPSRLQKGFPDDPWGTQPGDRDESWVGNWSPIYSAKHGTKAKGKVSDYSNAGWVRVDFDRFTGMSVYGLNMEVKWRGLSINGEINEYASFWSYPIYRDFKGAKHSVEKTRAWFLNVEKDFGKWGIGGELFDYPVDYMRYWATVEDNESNGGPAFPNLNVDWDMNNDYFQYGMPFIKYYFDGIAFGDDFNHNGTIDERENDDQIDLPYDRDSKGSHFFVKLKPRQYTMLSLGHYDVQQEFKCGRNLTDYIKAEHMQRIGNIMEYGLYHRTERVHDNSKSVSSYYQNLSYQNCRLHSTMLTTDFIWIPNLHIINNIKHDARKRYGDISFYGSPPLQTYLNVEKEARRYGWSVSTVHKIDYIFRLADFRLIPDLNWRGYRIMREKRIKELKLQPQFKLEQSNWIGSRRRTSYEQHYDIAFRRSRYYERYYNYYPVLRFDYRVAPNTLLRCAFQGFPGFWEKRRHPHDRLHDYDSRRFFVGFETTTLYQGFNLLVTSGMTRVRQSWVESFGRKGEGYTVFSINVRCETGG